MQQEKELVNLWDAPDVRLPLGYKNIYLRKIPPLEVENKLTFYNNKYRFNARQAFALSKPVSKIFN